MGQLHDRQTLKFTLKLVKFQSLVAKCSKMQKYKHVKFANFVLRTVHAACAGGYGLDDI